MIALEAIGNGDMVIVIILDTREIVTCSCWICEEFGRSFSWGWVDGWCELKCYDKERKG